MWHPVTPLLCWVGFAVALQWIDSRAWMVGVATFTFALSLFFAGERGRLLLWRARWLLASLVFLFVFFTPGEYLTGIPGELGATREGVARAADNLGRLVSLLASLALLHECIGTAGLLAGLHTLLRRFPYRDATVVRLLLVLEYAEQKRTVGWREWLGSVEKTENGECRRDLLALESSPLRFRDYAMLCAWIALLGVWVVRT
jgi:hypothetical protein